MFRRPGEQSYIGRAPGRVARCGAVMGVGRESWGLLATGKDPDAP